MKTRGKYGSPPWGQNFEGIRVLMMGIDKTKGLYYAATISIPLKFLGYSGNLWQKKKSEKKK